MSRAVLVDAIKRLDVDTVRDVLTRRSELKQFRNEKGLNLLQLCCSRDTSTDRAAADRQLRLARWLVSEGFDPHAIHTTAPGEDGEAAPAELSLVWFAVAKARNDRLARYFLERGARPDGFFAAAWWGNAGIMPELARHGADINEVHGATALYMAVDVCRRGADGNPDLARRRLRCIKTMLALGADLNIPADDGTTPLRLALKKEYFDAYKLLLQHGASPDEAGRDGRTVREVAARKKDRRWSSLLR